MLCLQRPVRVFVCTLESRIEEERWIGDRTKGVCVCVHLCLLSLSVQCGVARRSVGVKLVKLQQGQRAERRQE